MSLTLVSSLPRRGNAGALCWAGQAGPRPGVQGAEGGARAPVPRWRRGLGAVGGAVVSVPELKAGPGRDGRGVEEAGGGA